MLSWLTTLKICRKLNFRINDHLEFVIMLETFITSTLLSVITTFVNTKLRQLIYLTDPLSAPVYTNIKLLTEGLLPSNIKGLPYFKQKWMYELSNGYRFRIFKIKSKFNSSFNRNKAGPFEGSFFWGSIWPPPLQISRITNPISP